MRLIGILGGLLCAAVVAGAVHAQAPTTEELMRQIKALQRRVDELEGRQRAPTAPAHPATGVAAVPAAGTPKGVRVASVPAQSMAAGRAAPPTATRTVPAPAVIPGLRPPEPMGEQFEDALRSDLPGLSIGIPASRSEVRFYGFANVNAYRDFNGRNQTDAPTVQTIPLANSPAAIQGAISACRPGSAGLVWIPAR